MIAKIEVWGRWGEKADGVIEIRTDDHKLTKDVKKTIVSVIEEFEATDGIARNAFVKVFVDRRKYEFKYTTMGLERT